jgi:hypothetical protein
VWCGLDDSGSEYSPLTGSYEYGNEHSGSITRGKLIGQLSEKKLIFLDSAQQRVIDFKRLLHRGRDGKTI